MLKEKAFRFLTRLFLPSVARNMEEDGTFMLFEGEDAIVNEEDCFRIEDHGADVTIVIFSGMDVLFAGEPRFEMRKQLAGLGHNTNLVFVRDFRRMAYLVAPDGQPNGLEYYAHKVRGICDGLGAKHHVALGASGGGSAAFYFGVVCEMDHIIAFAPAFPPTVWTGWKPQVQSLLDFKTLFTHPSEYVEVVLVALSANVIMHSLRKKFGSDKFFDLLSLYENAHPRPQATIFYGDRCRPDANQAALIRHIPGIKLVPVPTGRHNCPGYLKERGQLASALHKEIREFFRDRGLTVGPVTTPSEQPVVEADTSSIPEHG